MISTSSLHALPGIDELKRTCQSIAMLDAIVMDEWDYRYYSFDAQWGDGEMLASMRNGSGDWYYILFNSAGAIIKGFAHESAMARYAVDSGQTWPGVLDQIPPEFEQILNDPAWVVEETTLWIWGKHEDPVLQMGVREFPDHADLACSAVFRFMVGGNRV